MVGGGAVAEWSKVLLWRDKINEIKRSQVPPSLGQSIKRTTQTVSSTPTSWCRHSVNNVYLQVVFLIPLNKSSIELQPFMGMKKGLAFSGS